MKCFIGRYVPLDISQGMKDIVNTITQLKNLCKWETKSYEKQISPYKQFKSILGCPYFYQQ